VSGVNPRHLAVSTHFCPRFFSTSSVIFSHSCRVLACFLGWYMVHGYKKNIYVAITGTRKWNNNRNEI
jgi:hypothetical protein